MNNMTKNERLFLAIGGVDETLLRRSEKPRRRMVWIKWAGMAAALALIVLAWTLLPKSPSVPPDTGDPAGPVAAPPDGQSTTPPAIREKGYQLLQFTVEQDEKVPRFSMFINEERYILRQEGDIYVIRSKEPAELPVDCRLEISHMAGTPVEKAMETIQLNLEGIYGSVGYDADRVLIYANNGLEWDSEQREVWFADDGQGGVFVFSSIYFMEATEGFGVSAKDMAGTFRVESEVQPWMAELENTSELLFQAVFADNLESVSGILAPGAEVHGYGEDVSEWMSVGGVDYAIDCDEQSGEAERFTAVVTVKHRPMGGEDPFSRLVMELSYSGEAGWQAERIELDNAAY